MTIYHQLADIQTGDFPAILAIGDSWFWYPKNNLLEALDRHPKLSNFYRNIFALGHSGALLQEYVGAGKYAKDMRLHLSPNFREGYAAFFISGVGNDAINFSFALLKDCHQITEPARCLANAGLDEFFNRISTAMTGLIHDIRWAYKDDAVIRPIFIHGYDYLIPDGRGFTVLGKTFSGPWIKPKMDRAKVQQDLEFRKAVCKEFINRLNEFMQRFNDPTQHVIFIDSRNTLRSDSSYQLDWDNEIHPTRSGFDKIVGRRWIPALTPYHIAHA